MPAQETSHNMPILIDKKFFLTVKQAPNKEKFHQSLRSLITRANKIYNNVFKIPRSEHAKSFPLCKKNYMEIQAIIKSQKFSINFFRIYYLEAELACIQSDFNALDFNLKSKKDLNLFKENLNKIKLNLEKFNKDLNDLNFIKKIDPEINDVFEKLLSYSNHFSNSWNENLNRLLGEIVCKKTTESHKPPQIQANKRKNSTNTTFFISAKKSKGNKQIDYKKLLAELKQVEIENYTLSASHSKNELIRYKASLAGKDALDRIEKLSFSIKNLSETEKLYCLKEAQNSFSHSIKFYNQAELIKESEKIIKYYDTLTLIIDSLESKVLASKPSIEKLILPSNKKSRQRLNNGYSHQPTRFTRTFFRELSCPENDVVQRDNPPSYDKPIYSS